MRSFSDCCRITRNSPNLFHEIFSPFLLFIYFFKMNQSIHRWQWWLTLHRSPRLLHLRVKGWPINLFSFTKVMNQTPDQLVKRQGEQPPWQDQLVVSWDFAYSPKQTYGIRGRIYLSKTPQKYLVSVERYSSGCERWATSV